MCIFLHTHKDAGANIEAQYGICSTTVPLYHFEPGMSDYQRDSRASRVSESANNAESPGGDPTGSPNPVQTPSSSDPRPPLPPRPTTQQSDIDPSAAFDRVGKHARPAALVHGFSGSIPTVTYPPPPPASLASRSPFPVDQGPRQPPGVASASSWFWRRGLY